MTIITKVGLSFTLLTLLLLITGTSGLFGVGKLSNSIHYLTGPAWDAADGVMEGTIGIQNEIIGLQRALNGEIGLDEANNLISSAQGFAGEALERMLASGLIGSRQHRLSTS